MTYQTDRRARGGLPRDGRPRGVTLPPPLRAALSAPRSVFPPALLGLAAVSQPPHRLQAFPSPSAPHCGSLTPRPSSGRRAAVLARCLSRSLFRLRFSSHAYSCLCTDVPSPLPCSPVILALVAPSPPIHGPELRERGERAGRTSRGSHCSLLPPGHLPVAGRNAGKGLFTLKYGHYCGLEFQQFPVLPLIRFGLH